MSKIYHHLTHAERCQIYALRKSGLSLSQVARQLERSSSTIWRELKRNSGRRGYRHQQAQTMASERRKTASSVPHRMTPDLCAEIDAKLREGWSPDQISGRLRQEGRLVGRQSIYTRVHADWRAGGTLWQHLRRRGKKPNWKGGRHAGRGHIPGRVDISKRPAVVEKKERIGDWEADTIIGKGHSGAVVSLVDRASKYTLLARVDRKTAGLVGAEMIRLLGRLPAHTITADNGKEFAGHALVSQKTGAAFFFATPYHSWERGLNEHTNGLVREYFPKETDFRQVSGLEIQGVADRLNARPRKVLGYLTPAEVLLGAQPP